MGASIQKSARRTHQQFFGKWEDDPDDEWKRQNEAANQIPMYRLVYLSGLGLLTIKYHNRSSDAEFEAFLKREVGPFVYEGGGRVIEEWDYIEYRKNVTQDIGKVKLALSSLGPAQNGEKQTMQGPFLDDFCNEKYLYKIWPKK